MLYQNILRPLLFHLDAEDAHELALAALRTLQNLRSEKVFDSTLCYRDPILTQKVLGLTLSNPIGLAAGFDKDAEFYSILSSFGFGAIECGTLTARAQSGNPLPRLFRYPEHRALINRMGFNNNGSQAAAARLKNLRKNSVPLGINIGKSKATALVAATEDYLESFTALYPFADYFTINVSSPNTPKLRELQSDLEPLLKAIMKKNHALSEGRSLKPIFVKVSPDNSFDLYEKIIEAVDSADISGIIATNTTTDHRALDLPLPQNGGLSGEPLRRRSVEVLRFLRKHMDKQRVLVSSGGIFASADVYERIRAGAAWVQVYTGWIYGGPFLVKRLNRELAQRLSQDGFHHISEAVGVDNA